VGTSKHTLYYGVGCPKGTCQNTTLYYGVGRPKGTAHPISFWYLILQSHTVGMNHLKSVCYV